MLTDLGLPDEEYYKRERDYKEWCNKQPQPFFPQKQGCISERICEGCGHRISDSICLCIGVFTCPNCKFENGQFYKDLMKQLSARNNTFQLNTYGVTNPPFVKLGYSKDDFIKIIDKIVRNKEDNGYKFTWEDMAAELKEEIEKL